MPNSSSILIETLRSTHRQILKNDRLFLIKIDAAKNVNHIAQNVPVTTAHDWAEEVVKFCLGKANMSHFSFLKQDNLKKVNFKLDK